MPSSTPKEARFMAKVLVTDSCWVWTACRDGFGRGRFRDGRHTRSAHKVAFELFKGKIIPGMSVCHTCDNPSCVNPAHLFLGTQQDNMSDCKAKGRIRNQNSYKTTCPLGHPLVLVRKDRVSRGCRECRRRRSREYQRRKRYALINA